METHFEALKTLTHFRASKLASTKARLPKHDLHFHGQRETERERERETEKEREREREKTKKREIGTTLHLLGCAPRMALRVDESSALRMASFTFSHQSGCGEALVKATVPCLPMWSCR